MFIQQLHIHLYDGSKLLIVFKRAREFVIRDWAHSRIRPDILRRLDHVDDGVDRQDDAHEPDGCTDGCH